MGGGGIAFKKQRIWAFLITRPSDLCNQGGSAVACKGLALTGEQTGEEGQGEKADLLITHPNTRLAEFVEKIAILFITHFKTSTFIVNFFRCASIS